MVGLLARPSSGEAEIGDQAQGKAYEQHVESSPTLGGGKYASPRPAQLTESAERRLRSVLRDAFPERLLSIPEGCRDGIRSAVTVHRREPYQGLRAWSELAKRDAHTGGPIAPVFRLRFLLLEMSLGGAPRPAQLAAGEFGGGG